MCLVNKVVCFISVRNCTYQRYVITCYIWRRLYNWLRVFCSEQQNVLATDFVNVQPLSHVYMLPVPATQLLPVCCPSVAGYKGIQCCRESEIHVAGNKQHVARQHVAVV